MSKLDIPPAKLPEDWTPLRGLYFPLTVNFQEKEKEFINYEDFHKFINNLFRPKNHIS